MTYWSRYRLRLRRKRWRLRAIRKRRELATISKRTSRVQPEDILLFCTLRNERARLPYFLQYYRKLGVGHFFFVDNGSDDGSREYLQHQPDVSLWRTTASYADSRFGVDWINWLLMRYAHGHWALVVDADEFLVYPFCDTRPLRALTDWMDNLGMRALGSMLLDMYPKEPIAEVSVAEGEDPFITSCWFDSGNYTASINHKYQNLWIQGGPRARTFFPDNADAAPSLNKIPLVRWNRQYVYASSTHALLPRDLNHVYDTEGGERISSVLLHAKFSNQFAARVAEEVERNQHYADSREYRAYLNEMPDTGTFWTPWSERYVNWRQLEMLGLMSKGSWI